MPWVEPPMTMACVLWKKSTWRDSQWTSFERGQWVTLLVNITQPVSLESSPHKSLQMKWYSYWNWSHDILLCESVLRCACGMGVLFPVLWRVRKKELDSRCDRCTFLVSAEMPWSLEKWVSTWFIRFYKQQRINTLVRIRGDWEVGVTDAEWKKERAAW